MDENRQVSLTDKQRHVINVLIQVPYVEEAAKLGGVSKTTIYKWFRLPVFREELTKQRNLLLGMAFDNLKGHVEKAIRVLAELLDAENPSIRRNAASDILAHVIKARELELEERLSDIERLVYEKRTYR